MSVSAKGGNQIPRDVAEPVFGQPIHVRYMGMDAYFFPWLRNGRPVQYPVDMSTDRELENAIIGEVEGRGKNASFLTRRAAVMCNVRMNTPRGNNVITFVRPRNDRDENGQVFPRRKFLQMYYASERVTVRGKKQQARIFEIPVTDGQESGDPTRASEIDGQTITIFTKINDGAGQTVDLYASKPGNRYAMVRDVIAVWAQAERNEKRQEDAAVARDPSAMQARVLEAQREQTENINAALRVIAKGAGVKRDDAGGGGGNG